LLSAARRDSPKRRSNPSPKETARNATFALLPYVSTFKKLQFVPASNFWSRFFFCFDDFLKNQKEKEVGFCISVRRKENGGKK